LKKREKGIGHSWDRKAEKPRAEEDKIGRRERLDSGLARPAASQVAVRAANSQNI